MHFISIDQNSNPLWDVVPKLQALTHAGYTGVHCLEDVDVAFTRRGTDTLDDKDLQIAAERFYRGGVTDWGATLFYSDFLGRTPLDPRSLEESTGLTLKSLGKRLDTDVDGIYDLFGGSDNHQLIGSSYIQDRDHHRTVGDLTLRDTVHPLYTLLEHAEHDISARFPAPTAQRRTTDWFKQQRAWLQKHRRELGDEAPLITLYDKWIQSLTRSTTVHTNLTSRLFAPTAHNANLALFSACVRHHADFCEAYNTAIQTTHEHLAKLKPERGDLPFFAVWQKNDRRFRTECHLNGNRLVTPVTHIEMTTTPLDAVHELQAQGLIGLVGKALPLVLQVRMKPGGAPLALPENGSLYMPTAHRLECELRQRKLIKLDLHPILRVKLGFLDRLAASKETMTLPEWLARRVGCRDIAAADFAHTYRQWQIQAGEELEQARAKDKREKLKHDLFPKLSGQIEELEDERRRVARNPETRHRASELWEQIKPLEQKRLRLFCRRMMDNHHVSELKYWNSRGAILPWAVAAGGEDWYRNEILEKATITEEHAPKH